MYFFRVLHEGGHWFAQRGRTVLAVFDDYDSARARAEAEASLHRPSAVVVHDATGRIDVVARFN